MLAQFRATVMLTCATIGSFGCASQYSEVKSFDRNDALVTSNGTVVLKGFGEANAGSVVCTVPGSPYAVDSSTKRSIDSSIGATATIKGAEDTSVTTRLAMAQTERLQALRETLSQLCIAYGNGLFGAVGTETAATKYQSAQEKIILMYTSFASPVEAPAPAKNAINSEGNGVERADGNGVEKRAAVR